MKKQFKKPIVFVALAVMIFVSLGLKIQPNRALAAVRDRYQQLEIFTKVLNLIQQYYVDKVSTQKLIYGGIQGMVSVLDPHTEYLKPTVFKEFQSETSGRFGGIGIEITVHEGRLMIIAPIEDTPAWKAGIKAGDRIVAIEGKDTKGMTLVEAAQLMRGKLGTKVHLKIMRDGFKHPKEFDVMRTTVRVKSVKYANLGHGYFYIRLTSFIKTSAAEMHHALQVAMKDNHGKLKGLILDLRNNPGGLLDQAVQISNDFLSKGIIVSTIGRRPSDKEVIRAKPSKAFAYFPMVVLINQYSASAAEILSGALHDNHRAVLMGQRSFGKGSVQSVVKLGDGSALKLTVARYYTPSGICIQARGITPDIVLDDINPVALEHSLVKEKIMREQDMAGHLEGTGKFESDNDNHGSVLYWTRLAIKKKGKGLTPKEKLFATDLELVEAYQYLKGWSVMHSAEIHAEATPASTVR